MRVNFLFLLFNASGYWYQASDTRDTSILLEDAGTFYTIVLNKDSRKEQLAEVTVTALGIPKKTNAVGYSIQEVKGDVVQTAKEPNFVNALQGKRRAFKSIPIPVQWVVQAKW